MQKSLIRFIKSPRLRKNAGIAVLIFGIVLFVLYLRNNPDALQPLSELPILVIPLLLVIYMVFLFTNYLVTHVSVTHFVPDYPKKSSFMLSAYTALVNFFGPLQSGPGFRAIYLKQQVGLSIKKYTLIAFIYYLSFAAISLMMISIAVHPLIPILVLIPLVFGFFKLKSMVKSPAFLSTFAKIFVFTALQLMVLSIIYGIEIYAVGYEADVSQILAYTGSSNLALFVAITPGAIGIREWFILTAQGVHNIPTEIVLSASLLDRAMYLLFLGVLFAISSYMNIKSRLMDRKIEKIN